jgi:hypothetical protein
MGKTDILIIAGIGAVGYYLYSKSKNDMPLSLEPTAPIPMPTAEPAKTTKYTYPEGIGKDGKKFELNDGDYVANGVETAILYQGQLRPMTAAYAAKFAAGTWERTKILDNIVYSSIPRGAVLDA